MIYMHAKSGRMWTSGSWDMKQREILLMRMRTMSVLQGYSHILSSADNYGMIPTSD